MNHTLLKKITTLFSYDKFKLSMKPFETPQHIIDFAVRAEEEAVRFYSELATTAKSKAMKTVFENLAKEEEGHRKKILSIDVNTLIFSESTPISDLHISDYINPEVKYENLNYGEALVIAMNREKRSFMLYDKLSKMVESEELKTLFSFLAKEEGDHKYRFETEYDEYVFKEN